MNKIQKLVLLFCAFFLCLGTVHIITTRASFRTETLYFENELFEWDDDRDSYDISIKEINEKGLVTLNHYYIKSNDAQLVYSEEDWSCFGEIKTYYNAYGRQLDKIVTCFYINVYKEN